MKIAGYDFKVYIEYKDVKNIYLRLLDAQVLYVTCPYKTKMEEIDKLILSKKDWLIKHSEILSKSYKGFRDPIYYLGNKYNLKLLKGRSNMEIVDSDIIIYQKEADFEKSRRIFYKKADEVLDYHINTFKDEYLRALFLAGYKKEPTIKYRLYKTRWGVCHIDRNLIELNELLIHYPIDCLKSVYWHELCHFIYSGHNKNFYELLFSKMPDYKEIQKKLR